MAKIITKAVEQVSTGDLINEVAHSSDYTAPAVKEIINDFLEVMRKKIVEGHTVVIRGIGRFKTSTRAARVGRNPKTGESIDIKPVQVVRFKPSTTVKSDANTKK